MLTNEPQPPPTPPPPKPSVDRRPPSPTDTSDAANIHADDAPLTNPCSSDTNKIVQERPEQVLGSIRLQTPTSVGELGSDSDLQEIIAGYERRLQEQVALARQDVLKELEVQIQVSGKARHGKERFRC